MEAAFGRYCDVPYCVGLGSGLDALRLALLAIEAEPGEEAILPANTYVATAEAVVQAGLVPVLADASERDYNLDPDAVMAAVTPRTRVIVPVHLYGQMADMVRLLADARRRGLDVVEDACQAHGARRDGLGAGAAGRAGTPMKPKRPLFLAELEIHREIECERSPAAAHLRRLTSPPCSFMASVERKTMPSAPFTSVRTLRGVG